MNDHDAMIESLGDHRDALYRMALSITRDPHLAGDLVQDTMVRAMQRIDQFSADGSLLYATENAFDSGEGRIGLYAADDGFRRRGEFASHGIGPHQLCLAPDGQTLLVANGGIRTHPDYRRRGLAAIAAAAAVEHALAHGYTSVCCHCNVDNRGSIRTAQKVGFVKERDYVHSYCMVH